MIFQHTWQQVMSGEKTQTRRLVKLGEWLDNMDLEPPYVTTMTRLKWQVGRTYAVQPGRGKKAIARIRVTGIRLEDVRHISDDDVQAEGFASHDEFIALWESMHGDNYQAWVIEFELVKGGTS